MNKAEGNVRACLNCSEVFKISNCKDLNFCSEYCYYEYYSTEGWDVQ